MWIVLLRLIFQTHHWQLLHQTNNVWQFINEMQWNECQCAEIKKLTYSIKMLNATTCYAQAQQIDMQNGIIVFCITAMACISLDDGNFSATIFNRKEDFDRIRMWTCLWVFVCWILLHLECVFRFLRFDEWKKKRWI